MTVRHTSDEVELSITRVETPPIVVQGLEIVVPEAPIGEVGVLLDARMIPVEVVPIPFGPTTTTASLVTARGLYMGHSVKEPTALAGAAFDLIDGTDAKGNLLCPVTLVANESSRDWYPLPGVSVRRGLFVNVLAGTVSGVVYFGVPEGEGARLGDRS